MVAVTLWGGLVPFADNQKTIDVEASDIRELFQKLSEQYPGLRRHFKSDVAVVIDGVVYRDNWSKELTEDNEVFLIRRIAGG